MLYQLSYASPNNRASRPKNKTLAPVSQQVHNCQGYHRAEGLRNLPEGRFDIRLPALADPVRSKAGCYHSSTDEGGKPYLACPGAPRRPSSLFCSFSCWWGWLHTCGARPRPKPRGCFRNLTVFSISTCGRCAPTPTSTSTRCPTTPSINRLSTPPASNSSATWTRSPSPSIACLTLWARMGRWRTLRFFSVTSMVSASVLTWDRSPRRPNNMQDIP